MTPAELRAAMLKLPEPVTTDKPPHWTYWKWDLWKRVTSGENPENFFGWPCVYHTMLTNHWKEPMRVEYEALPQEKQWLESIRAPSIGKPVDYHALTPYSRNLIHQAYHFHRFQTVAGKQIAEMETIVEIGGGYGAACLVARRLGFQGKYIIYDLPEFSLLQQWYLSQVGVEGVEFVTELPKKQKKVDMLIGLYSLSEMPMELRTRILISKYVAQSYLLLYSQNWVNYDNKKYFQGEFTGVANDLKWQHEEIAHLPDKGNWYSFGWYNV